MEIVLDLCLALDDAGTLPNSAIEWQKGVADNPRRYLMVMCLDTLRDAFSRNRDVKNKVLVPTPRGPWLRTNAQLSIADFGRLLAGEVVRAHPAVLEHVSITVKREPLDFTDLVEVKGHDGSMYQRPAPSLSAKPFLEPEEAVPVSGSIEEAEQRHAIRLEAMAASRGMGFTGDACGTCGAFAMVRTGTCVTCQECSATGGCG